MNKGHLFDGLAVLVEQVRCPVFSQAIESQTGNLVGTTSRGDPNQSKGPVKAQRIACVPRKIARRERRCCNGELGPHLQINVPGRRSIECLSDLLWDSKRLFRNEIKRDPASRFSTDRMRFSRQVGQVAAHRHEVVGDPMRFHGLTEFSLNAERVSSPAATVLSNSPRAEVSSQAQRQILGPLLRATNIWFMLL